MRLLFYFYRTAFLHRVLFLRFDARRAERHVFAVNPAVLKIQMLPSDCGDIRMASTDNFQ